MRELGTYTLKIQTKHCRYLKVWRFEITIINHYEALEMYATIIFMSTRVLTNKEAAEVPVPKSHLFNVQHHVICILKWRPEFIMSD